MNKALLIAGTVSATLLAVAGLVAVGARNARNWVRL